MPLYEYECGKCRHVVEVLQKFSDAPLTKCPDCGGKVHKLMSRNAFHLKGGGWYVSDYQGKAAAPKSDAESPAVEAPAPKTESKAESSAAAASE